MGERENVILSKAIHNQPTPENIRCERETSFQMKAQSFQNNIAEQKLSHQVIEDYANVSHIQST
jgi:hypothetical protein